MTSKIPEVLTNVKVYSDGASAHGTGNVKLPNIEAMTETITGAGISGEVEVPVAGHYKAMKVEIEFYNMNSVFSGLSVGESCNLQIRGSLQVYEQGKRDDVPIKVSVLGRVLSSERGTLEPGKKTSPKTTVSVEYYKEEFDGQVITEIDPLNFIAILNGKNVLAKVAENLGLGGSAGGATGAVKAAFSKIGI